MQIVVQGPYSENDMKFFSTSSYLIDSCYAFLVVCSFVVVVWLLGVCVCFVML